VGGAIGFSGRFFVLVGNLVQMPQLTEFTDLQIVEVLKKRDSFSKLPPTGILSEPKVGNCLYFNWLPLWLAV
jgi:hypothetical protein